MRYCNAYRAFSDGLHATSQVFQPVWDLTGRDRVELFNKVQSRVTQHRNYLDNRGKDLTDKLGNVSTQCVSLIDAVKNGSL